MHVQGLVTYIQCTGTHCSLKLGKILTLALRSDCDVQRFAASVAIEKPQRKCAKIQTVAASNNRDHSKQQ